MSVRVVVGGQRNCGKSTLTASLYVQLTAAGLDVGLYEIDTFSDTLPCILGKKPWEKREKRKAGNWADPLIDIRLKEFADDTHPFVLGDLPGIVDGLLEKLVQSATHAIILTKDYAALIEWREFFKRQNIPVILEVVSHQGQLPLMPRDLDLLYVKDLDRKVHHDGDVSAITKALIQKFKLN